MSERLFYVYEHHRPDTSTCFYVGKGFGKRAFDFRKRNRHHTHICAALKKAGLSVEVKIVADGLKEEVALALEIATILERRDSGAPLTNITAGGDGVSGMKHTDVTKEILRIKGKNRKLGPCSEETKRKIAAAQKGILRGPNPDHSKRLQGRKHTEAHRAAISASNKGRVFSESTKTAISKALRGRTFSDDRKAALSRAHIGIYPSEDSRRARSASLKETWLGQPIRREVLSKRMQGNAHALKGKGVHSEATRLKVSQAVKAWWDARKAAPECKSSTL